MAAAVPSGSDQTAQLCQSLKSVNFDENNPTVLVKASDAEQTGALGGGDSTDTEDPCYEVHWRQLESELKKNEIEQKADAGDAPPSGAGESEQQKANASQVLLQEEEVMDKFQMPALKTFYADLSSIKTNKIVMVYPLSEEKLFSPELEQVKKSEECIEYRVRNIRQGMDSVVCFVSLYFSSKASAEAAVEQLKKDFPEQQIEFASQESLVNKVIATWSSSQQPNAQLPDCTLLIKNIGNTVTVDKLKELLPSAEDVVLPREKQDGKGPLRNKGYAYAVFLTSDAAQSAFESCAKDKPELDGRALKVLKYFEPKSKPEGLLTLVERKLVLKQGTKSASMIEKKKSGEEVKAIDSWRKKLQVCLKLIKQDNELRQELGLPVLSYDDLCAIKDLPILDSKRNQQIMERLGIFFAKSTDKASSVSSTSLHKTTTSGAVSKTLKAQRNWHQDKRNKRPIHRPGIGRGLLGTPGAMQGNMSGLLGSGPMVQGMYGQHGAPYSGGYGRFNYKGQYRNYPGNQRDLASSVGLLVNLSQMLAQQVHHQQHQYGQQRPTGTQNMYNHGDYNQGAKFPQQNSDRSLGAAGHYEGAYGNSSQYHQNRPFYSGY